MNSIVAVAMVMALGTLPGTATRTDQVADGVFTHFYFNFKTTSTTHIEVFLAGVKQSTGYALVLNPNQDSAPGGNVTFTTAPVAGVVVRIQRTVPLTQASVWQPFIAFKAKTLEGQLDNLVMQGQQVDRRAADADAARAADKDAQVTRDAGQDATHAADKAAQAARDGGQDVTVAGLVNSIAGFNGTSHAVTDTSSLLALGTSQPRTLTVRAADEVNVLDFTGADPSGVANSAAAFTAAAATGKRVRVPAGTYRLDTLVMGRFLASGGVTFTGAGGISDYVSIDYAKRSGLNRTKYPRRLWTKLRTHAYNVREGITAPTRIRIFAFGDSMSGAKPPVVADYLRAALGTAGTPTSVAAYLDGYDSRPTQMNTSVVAGTFNTVPADGFTYWPMGPLPHLAPGSRVKFIYNGVDPSFTDAFIYYVKEPGAGTLQVLVNGAVVATLDANAAVGLGKYTITQAFAQKTVEILNSSGADVRIVGSWIVYDNTQTDVELWNAGVSGVLLADAMASSTSRLLFQAWLTDVDPDLTMVEMADVMTAWESSLNQLADILDVANPVGDKVFVANPATAAETYYPQREVTERVAYQRGYIFFDGNTPLGTHDEMVALGWQGDGIHPTGDAQEFLASLLVQQLGLSSIHVGADFHPTIAVKAPSRLATGTTFEYPLKLGTLALKFDTDSFSQDWSVHFWRSLNFVRGDGTIAMTIGDGGGWHNVLPSKFDFDTRGGAESMERNTTNGYPMLRLLNTSGPGGFMDTQSLPHLPSFTRATMPSASPRTGALIYVTDGSPTNTPCVAYATGGAWVRLPENTTITP